MLAGEIGDVIGEIPDARAKHSQPWQYDVAKSNGTLAEVNDHDIDPHCAGLRKVNFRKSMPLPEIIAVLKRENFPDFYDNVVMTAI